VIVHDILIHQRLRWKLKVKNKYLKRLIHAHYIHHRKHTRDGCEAFGFLYAPENTSLLIRRPRPGFIPNRSTYGKYLYLSLDLFCFIVPFALRFIPGCTLGKMEIRFPGNLSHSRNLYTVGCDLYSGRCMGF